MAGAELDRFCAAHLAEGRERVPLPWAATTMEEIVTTMERRYGQARRVWVMDRGMVGAENIAWLQSSQRHYLIGTSKSELKKFAAQLADRAGLRQVRDGSKPRSVPARTAARRCCWCVRLSDSRRNRQMHAGARLWRAGLTAKARAEQ